MLLDDSFSALDGKTESLVIENLLGREGVFRKRACTVLWITNSSMVLVCLILFPLLLIRSSQIFQSGRRSHRSWRFYDTGARNLGWSPRKICAGGQDHSPGVSRRRNSSHRPEFFPPGSTPRAIPERYGHGPVQKDRRFLSIW